MIKLLICLTCSSLAGLAQSSTPPCDFAADCVFSVPITINQTVFGGQFGVLLRGLRPDKNWPVLAMSLETSTGPLIGTQIVGQIVSNTPGQEAMDLTFRAMSAGAGPSEVMRIHGNAVGIGTVQPCLLGSSTTPSNCKLSVNGAIQANEVVVNTGWPDFVFDPARPLPSLQSIESFIKEHKHLPNVPSAREVELRGVQIGAMEATLLEKIEELTLLMIAADRQAGEIRRDNHFLRDEVNRLREAVSQMQRTPQ